MISVENKNNKLHFWRQCRGRNGSNRSNKFEWDRKTVSVCLAARFGVELTWFELDLIGWWRDGMRKLETGAASWGNDIYRFGKWLTRPRADNPINKHLNSPLANTQITTFVNSDSPTLDFQLEIIALLALIFHDLNMLIDYDALLPTTTQKKRGPQSRDPGDHWSLH